MEFSIIDFFYFFEPFPKSIIELKLFEVLVGIGCYFYSHNLAAIKMVTQSHKAEAIRFYDYCLTNANVIILF